MILYVVADSSEQYLKKTSWFATRNLLEEIAGDACVVLHYKQLDLATLEQMRPWAVCHSGSSTDYTDYDVLTTESYRRVVLEYDSAQIGFCGGHQIIASYCGCKLGPIRRLRPGEPDLSGDRHPGQFKEWGVYPVQVVRADPLFRGCGRTVRVQEYHYWEVKKLSPELLLLASSRDCRVQAFRHCRKPIYGTQFHPEASPEAYQDGRKILGNFFRLARDYRDRVIAEPGSAEPAASRRRGKPRA